MRQAISPLPSLVLLVLLSCLRCAPAAAQADLSQTDPKQAICQASWERCLGTGGGKNWKPIYDRCVKARTTCLGGRAYSPPSFPVGTPQPMDGNGNDLANADPATATALCDKGDARGARNGCVLAPAGDGYGQSFSLLGPAVPLSRMQRASSVVKCAGGKTAMFYANGRIESCTLDAGGGTATPLTDVSGKVTNCAGRSLARFDPEGRLLSCDAS